MSMNALECWSTSENQQYQVRVRFYINKAAFAVFSEPLDTVGHAQRLAFAKLALLGQYAINQISMTTFNHAPLKEAADYNDYETSGLTDEDVEAGVNAVFNALAGVDSGT